MRAEGHATLSAQHEVKQIISFYGCGVSHSRVCVGTMCNDVGRMSRSLPRLATKNLATARKTSLIGN